jgi:dihydroneopterin aldolase
LKPSAFIELRDLHLTASIGTYGPTDVVPNSHILDLTLEISPTFVQVPFDDMSHVFDYDPLIARIDEIAADQQYETQEYLMTLIARACAQYDQIIGLDICLKKQPVRRDTGSLGVRLCLSRNDLLTLRTLQKNH